MKRQHLLVAVGLLIVLIAFWIGGLFLFAADIPNQPSNDTEITDGIVVLTGGTRRLETGLALLAAKRGKKLFVSGVHQGTDVAELMRVYRTDPKLLDCCLKLGYTADDTIGNARETAEWAAIENIKSLRVVTSNYHMRRSLFELERVMPNVRLIPHPVVPDHVKSTRWWNWPGSALLIVSEYNKYILAGLRLRWTRIAESREQTLSSERTP
ncbi:MAG: YdcF family protein [Alphaproteobacteria bacterium]